jgi:hypothetical protein
MASSPTLAPKRVMADLRLRSAEYGAGIISRPHMRLSTIHPVQKGSKTDEGFQPLGNLGFSIQGVPCCILPGRLDVPLKSSSSGAQKRTPNTPDAAVAWLGVPAG